MKVPDEYFEPPPLPDHNVDLVATLKGSLARMESGNATQADVVAMLDFSDKLKQLTRDIGRRVDDAACAFIQTHGEMTVGTIRYYAGTTTYTKCKDVRATFEALLEKTGGDLSLVGQCLKSDAWKSGACKGVLDDEFEKLFSVEVVKELKTGEPRKSLHRGDTRFLPAKESEE